MYQDTTPYQDPLVVRTVERARRWREDRAVTRAERELASRYNELAKRAPAREWATAAAAAAAAVPQCDDLLRRRRERQEQRRREHARCVRLAGVWQRLLDHDCLACTPDDPEACPVYTARNLEVDLLARSVTRWRARRVFHSLDHPRRRWWNGKRRWA